MPDRLLSPTKISAWLECSHSLSLSSLVDSGVLSHEPVPAGSLAEVLIDKGASHEAQCLAYLESVGRDVHHVAGRRPGEGFDEWASRSAHLWNEGHDVLYQMPLVHEGMRGIADFVWRVPGEDGFAYEPVDAKLTRQQGKPGHVLQLCFYAEAIEAATGRWPRQFHLWLGSGNVETLDPEHFRPYWRRLRRQLARLLASEPDPTATRPVPCAHCEVCEFAPHCESQWRHEDSLVYVATIRAREREALEEAGVSTLAALAERATPVLDVHEESLRRLRRQARLQVVSRQGTSEAPAFEPIGAEEDPIYGHGFELLPRASSGDVYFDFEGHPFWRPESDLFFLAGLLYSDESGQWIYDARWAHDLDEQADMIGRLVEFFEKRRLQYPDYHVYHYNHTERSALERLTRASAHEAMLQRQVDTGLYVDLFAVVRNALVVGVESYGLKSLERLAGFRRHGDIEKGSGAVVEYEHFMQSGEPEILASIASYNEQDVAATRALHDWLIEQRPDDLNWREASMEVEDVSVEADEMVEALHQLDPAGPEHLLGDLLNYWRRERSAYLEPKFARAQSDYTSLYGDRDYIANLRSLGFQQVEYRGNTNTYLKLTWPDQLVDTNFKRGEKVLYAGAGVERGFSYLYDVDLTRREMLLKWGEFQEGLGGVPAVVTLDGYVQPGSKPGALMSLARQIVVPDVEDPPSRVSLDLLGRLPPRLTGGRTITDFANSLEGILEWVGDLDESYASIQGPPGTGKTYTGAHIIAHLLQKGQRVGVTAMSHAAIDNLVSAAHSVLVETGRLDLLRGVRVGATKDTPRLDGIRYRARRDAASDVHNLVAGTTWLWSHPEMRPFPVDVLIIDEAGQLALADALAAANGARNLVLLGDPLQLAQVAQAEHPGDSGASVLEHVLRGHPTMPAHLGVFLSETRRMHPDVCRFISEQIYEGRLVSHETCTRQHTVAGTGLRWLRVMHQGRSTESPEEAEAVVERIRTLLASPWTDQHGMVRPLLGADFMVVAPYNDQVRLLRRHLDSAGLDQVQVGTVDKFQGREAPVVFFTMTTSTHADMPRGPEFLFSRNRLNVAVSRARGLAYLVCTDELLNARARTIEEMRLIGTLCAFVDYAELARA